MNSSFLFRLKKPSGVSTSILQSRPHQIIDEIAEQLRRVKDNAIPIGHIMKFLTPAQRSCIVTSGLGLEGFIRTHQQGKFLIQQSRASGNNVKMISLAATSDEGGNQHANLHVYDHLLPQEDNEDEFDLPPPPVMKDRHEILPRATGPPILAENVDKDVFLTMRLFSMMVVGLYYPHDLLFSTIYGKIGRAPPLGNFEQYLLSHLDRFFVRREEIPNSTPRLWVAKKRRMDVTAPNFTVCQEIHPILASANAIRFSPWYDLKCQPPASEHVLSTLRFIGWGTFHRLDKPVEFNDYLNGCKFKYWLQFQPRWIDFLEEPPASDSCCYVRRAPLLSPSRSNMTLLEAAIVVHERQEKLRLKERLQER